jgi:hypothetical protein
MKKLTHIVLAVLLAGSMTSCDMIGELFGVDGETLLFGLMMISVDGSVKSTTGFDFYEVVVIDPLDDDDIEEYKESISQIEATNIVATVTSVNGENVIFEEGSSITVKGSEQVVWTLEEPWVLEVGDELTLEDVTTSSAYKKVTEMLSDLEPLTIIAEGTCNQSGVSITLKVGIDVSYTASL